MEKKKVDLKFQEQLYQVQLTNTITQTKMKYQDITL